MIIVKKSTGNVQLDVVDAAVVVVVVVTAVCLSRILLSDLIFPVELAAIKMKSKTTATPKRTEISFYSILQHQLQHPNL